RGNDGLAPTHQYNLVELMAVQLFEFRHRLSGAIPAQGNPAQHCNSVDLQRPVQRVLQWSPPSYEMGGDEDRGHP
ncbi:MAG: hypothetical protein OXN21_09260, partial [Chloroflexota bacterium]|nr:hypothetical protein [Chloroflexota bacterium]